jgi:hypothetical protein
VQLHRPDPDQLLRSCERVEITALDVAASIAADWGVAIAEFGWSGIKVRLTAEVISQAFAQASAGQG